MDNLRVKIEERIGVMEKYEFELTQKISIQPRTAMYVALKIDLPGHKGDLPWEENSVSRWASYGP